LTLVAALVVLSCSKPYRIGEHVWVEWDGKRYRAFVVERTGSTRFRVQFEGCDSHWTRDVTLDKIVERLDEAEASRAPSVVACSQTGPTAKGEAGVAATPYKIGDRVRVRWRGSVYTASVLSVVAPDRFLVHYEGLENAWDEVVPLERIEGPR
jgi:primosomal protein N'